MPEDSNQKATPLSGFDFLKKLGIGRVKRVDPVDSDLSPCRRGRSSAMPPKTDPIRSKRWSSTSPIRASFPLRRRRGETEAASDEPLRDRT